MNDVASPRKNFNAFLERVHEIGRDVLALHAASVDRDARFPSEALDALKAARLLGAYVPLEHGGMGLELHKVARICEVLGQYCASTAMIYAMHQIQVACVVHHALGSDFFTGYARQIAEDQLLLASATTELGTGGDLRSSICAIKINGTRFTLTKQAPVISYALAADAIFVTCRRAEDAPSGDQLHVLVRKGDYKLTPLCGWDTLGFRGTCSPGFTLESEAPVEQILPVPYSEIHAKTMHPYSHIVWGSLWLGLATDALNRARVSVRAEARKRPDITPISAIRLAEADTVLYSMRAGVAQAIAEYAQMLAEAPLESYANFGFSIKVNNLKLTCSQQVVDIVSKAMLISGIAGYRNDSKTTLGRHLRDAFGAALMVNNDRILGLNATMQIVQKEG